MNIIIDAILLIIIAICLLSGYMNGFVKTVIKLISGVAAFIIAFIVSPIVSGLIYDLFYYDTVKNIINNELLKLGYSDAAGIFTEGALNGILGDLMDICGFSLTELQSHVSNASSIEDVCTMLAEKFAQPIANATSYVTAFILVFVLAAVAVFFISSVLKLATKLPVIKQADKLLGLIMGAVSAIIFSTVYMTTVKLSIPYLSLISSGISADILESTFLFKHLYELNLLQKLFEYVNISSSLLK